MTKRLRWLAFLFMPWFALMGCGTTQTVSLPPQYCKPATDLAQPKHLKRVPEAATKNDEFYSLFLMERADHATDIRDYNSLLRTCVDPTLPEHIPTFAN